MKTQIISTLSFLFLALTQLAHAEIPMGYFESEQGQELFIRTSGERVFAFYSTPQCWTDHCSALFQLEETEDASVALRRVEGSDDNRGVLTTNPVALGSLQMRVRHLRGGRESLELVMSLAERPSVVFARARRQKAWLDTPTLENFFGVDKKRGDLTIMAGGSGVVRSGICAGCSGLRVQVAADGIIAVNYVSHDMERESGLSLSAGTRGIIVPISAGGLVRQRIEYRFVNLYPYVGHAAPHNNLYPSQTFIAR